MWCFLLRGVPLPHFRDILSNKNFLLLWLGQIISNFGDRLNQMALVALVYMHNPGSEIALAKLISFTIIPVFLIGPIAGVWADRIDRRKLMIFADLARGCLVLCIPLCIWAHQILLVYLIIFLTFSLGRFFLPSKMAIIPDIVPKESLLMANTLQSTTTMIGNVAGLVVAGVIVNIRFVGAIGGFYIDAVTFFVSATLIALMVRERFTSKVREGIVITGDALKASIRRSFFHEVREGMTYLMTFRNMRLVMAAFFLLMAGLGMISCVIIVFIQNVFGTSTRDLGFIGMFFVAGLFLGTLVFGKFGHRIEKRKAIFLSFLESGICVALFAVFVPRYPNLLAAGGIAAMLGASASPIMVIVNTLTHESIPEEARGRIFSSLEVIIHLSFLVFMFIAAYTARYIDRSWILVSTGVVFAFCGFIGLALDGKGRPDSPKDVSL